MTMGQYKQRRSFRSAADLDAALDRIAATNIEELRELWRQRRGQFPPEALCKDLIGRALAHWDQEEQLGGLDPHVRKLIAALVKKGPQPTRHLKIGSVIVREHQGRVHEVLVVPGGFCWQGQTYSSLSTIAKAITGTSWNGPRFFGLRGGEEAVASEKKSVAVAGAVLPTEPSAPRKRSRSELSGARGKTPNAANTHYAAGRGGDL
jgi:Protein of unknown function (DUF2924)